MRLIFLTFLTISLASASLHHNTLNYYILHHDPTYASLVDVADLLGLQIVEPIGELKDFWLARTESPRDSLGKRVAHNSTDEDDSVIATFRNIRRRSTLSRRGEDISEAIKHLSRQVPRKFTHRAPFHIKRDAPSPEKDPAAVAKELNITDPLFAEQTSIVNKFNPGSALNVVPVWKLGVTGKGVITTIVDDGILFSHKDIKQNYLAKYSYNYMHPQGKLIKPKTEHGTACAGVIAAAKNTICGLGLAYDSKVADQRIIGPNGESDDVHITNAFGKHFKDVSIYSCSWGPLDDGATVEEPPYVVKQALLNGVTNGRHSGEGPAKGNIFVFAAGNGGSTDDECNYDGYVNSIYTIAIGALDRKGQPTHYSEGCTAVMVVTFSSSDDLNAKGVTSLGIANDTQCVSDFGGTSAAAPAATAIFALALEARPELTWRDMQYLCVETGRPFKRDGVYWHKLASGREYSDQLGYGALDAYAFVTKAKEWKLVTPQVWITPPYVQFQNGTMEAGRFFSGGERLSKKGVFHAVEITEAMAQEHNFGAIEHVQIKVWVQHERRGDIEVTIQSPKKVVSKVGKTRMYDESPEGLPGWTFTSLRHWGESPVGSWNIKINDQSCWGECKAPEGTRQAIGKVIGFSMTFWGCAKDGKADATIYQIPADDGNVFPPKDLKKPMGNSTN